MFYYQRRTLCPCVRTHVCVCAHTHVRAHTLRLLHNSYVPWHPVAPGLVVVEPGPCGWPSGIYSRHQRYLPGHAQFSDLNSTTMCLCVCVAYLSLFSLHFYAQVSAVRLCTYTRAGLPACRLPSVMTLRLCRALRPESSSAPPDPFIFHHGTCRYSPCRMEMFSSSLPQSKQEALSRISTQVNSLKTFAFMLATFRYWVSHTPPMFLMFNRAAE